MSQTFLLLITADNILPCIIVLLDVNRQPTVSGLLIISAIFDISSRRHAVSPLALPGDYGLDRMRANLLRRVNRPAAAVLLLINQACSAVIFC